MDSLQLPDATISAPEKVANKQKPEPAAVERSPTPVSEEPAKDEQRQEEEELQDKETEQVEEGEVKGDGTDEIPTDEVPDRDREVEGQAAAGQDQDKPPKGSKTAVDENNQVAVEDEPHHSKNLHLLLNYLEQTVLREVKEKLAASQEPSSPEAQKAPLIEATTDYQDLINKSLSFSAVAPLIMYNVVMKKAGFPEVGTPEYSRAVGYWRTLSKNKLGYTQLLEIIAEAHDGRNLSARTMLEIQEIEDQLLKEAEQWEQANPAALQEIADNAAEVADSQLITAVYNHLVTTLSKLQAAPHGGYDEWMNLQRDLATLAPEDSRQTEASVDLLLKLAEKEVTISKQAVIASTGEATSSLALPDPASQAPLPSEASDEIPTPHPGDDGGIPAAAQQDPVQEPPIPAAPAAPAPPATPISTTTPATLIAPARPLPQKPSAFSQLLWSTVSAMLMLAGFSYLLIFTWSLLGHDALPLFSLALTGELFSATGKAELWSLLRLLALPVAAILVVDLLQYLISWKQLAPKSLVRTLLVFLATLAVSTGLCTLFSLYPDQIAAAASQLVLPPLAPISIALLTYFFVWLLEALIRLAISSLSGSARLILRLLRKLRYILFLLATVVLTALVSYHLADNRTKQNLGHSADYAREGFEDSDHFVNTRFAKEY